MAMATLSLPPCGAKPLSLSINGSRCFSVSTSRPTRSLSVANRCNASLFSPQIGTLFYPSPMKTQLERRHNRNQWRRGGLVVCEAGTEAKNPDSALKRLRQNEKRRLRNKARKSEIRTRMRRVLGALGSLRKKKDASMDDILQIEKMMSITYSRIDKAVRVGVMHKNTASHRKSRMARRKKAIMIYRGWYTPAPAETETETASST
ncbi:hypothetical protein LUZ60_001083 [Juncus effusus]|nr:hypothetical protein LUZ60_001083 [Juncus effusus]